MGSNRRKLGAGTPQVGGPAPRRKMDTPEEAIAELRELLAEARGVLSDLVRERKAVEALARTRAEQVIESTAQCMDELNAHIAETIRITRRFREALTGSDDE